MLDIIYYLALLGGGIGLMLWGADALIGAVQYISHRYELNPIMTGAVLLGFGTSLPEIVISFNSLAKDIPLVAYGNALGSNIANIGLILGLGLCLSLRPLVTLAAETRYQFVMLGLSVLVFGYFALDAVLTPLEAWLSMMLFLASLAVMLLSGSAPQEDAYESADYEPPGFAAPLLAGIAALVAPQTRPRLKLVLMLIASIAAVGFGGELTVDSAELLATALGIPSQVVALVLIALGTSLPELVVTVKLALRGKPKFIIGNIVGSNIFNLLLVLPIVHSTKPLLLERGEVYRDGGVMIMLTALFLLFAFSWNGSRQMHRKAGALFLLSYAGYLAYLMHLTLS